jgi:hypothetical protein
VGVDVEALVRGRAEQTLRGLLDGALKPKDGESNDPGKALLDGILGRGSSTPSPDGGSTPPSGDTNAAPAEDPVKSIAGEALKGLFGRKPKPAEEEPAPAEEPN